MRAQAGAISTGQLRAAALTTKNLRALVRSAALLPRHRGVYVDGRSPSDARTHLWAAQLALGPTAFFSHRSAAAMLGLRPVNARAIEITVVRNHTPSRRGLTVHRATVAPAPRELGASGGLRHSSAARMLLEQAAREQRSELDRLIAECARRRLLQLDQVEAVLAAHPRAPGTQALRAALRRYIPPTEEDKSGFERDFAAWLATLPGIPRLQRNVHLGPREIDFHFPDQRLVVETDGEQYHRTPAELERDRRKDAWLQRHGYRILRVTGFRFAHDRAGGRRSAGVARAVVGGAAARTRGGRP